MEKFILFLLGCFVWQVSVAGAGALEQGIRFFEQKDYEQAKELWQPLAKKGDARAQYNLALLMYKYAGDDQAQNNLQRQEAGKYLAMSRSEGLVDAYFTTISDFASAVVISDPLVWLNQQQKTSYTLQLATGKSRESMEKMQKKLLSSQSLEQSHNLYIHKVERNVQQKIVVHYILVYGIFKTYQDAKNEIDRLPEPMQKSSPWIRQFGVLQSIVNAKRRNKET